MHFILMFTILPMFAMLQTYHVQISPHSDKIIVVKTDHESRENHHPILDDPTFSRLVPFQVTVRTIGNRDIRSMAVVYDVVDTNGITHNFPMYYAGPNDGHFAVVKRDSSTTFWPGGRMPKILDHPNPLMPLANETMLRLLETCKSIAVSFPFIEFSDGTIVDSGGWTQKVLLIKQNRAYGKWRDK